MISSLFFFYPGAGGIHSLVRGVQERTQMRRNELATLKHVKQKILNDENFKTDYKYRILQEFLNEFVFEIESKQYISLAKWSEWIKVKLTC